MSNINTKCEMEFLRLGGGQGGRTRSGEINNLISVIGSFSHWEEVPLAIEVILSQHVHSHP